MARAEADMALTPAGSPSIDPPYVTAPLGTAAAGALQPEDDDDEEAQMLQGPVSHPLYQCPVLSKLVLCTVASFLCCCALCLSSLWLRCFPYSLMLLPSFFCFMHGTRHMCHA